MPDEAVDVDGVGLDEVDDDEPEEPDEPDEPEEPDEPDEPEEPDEPGVDEGVADEPEDRESVR